jgi:hypothetical protein
MRRFWLLLLAGFIAPNLLGNGVTFKNVDLGLTGDATYVAPGAWVLAQKIQADAAVTITKVVVYNRVQTPSLRVLGADVERIEVRRTSDGKLMGSAYTSTALAKFAEADGVTINTTTNNVIAAGGYIEIWVKLRSTVPLGQKAQTRRNHGYVRHYRGVNVYRCSFRN